MFRSHRHPVKPSTGPMTGIWDPVPGTRCSVPPITPGKLGTVTTPGTPITPSSSVTPGESVRPVHTGQKAQLEKADQCLAQSELLILNSPDRSVQLEHNVHEPLGLLCRLNICQSILMSFKTLRTLTVRMSGQTSRPNELIRDIQDIGLRASVTPATHWASVTMVTVQTMSIQSTDLGRLGRMLLSTVQQNQTSL